MPSELERAVEEATACCEMAEHNGDKYLDAECLSAADLRLILSTLNSPKVEVTEAMVDRALSTFDRAYAIIPRDEDFRSVPLELSALKIAMRVALEAALAKPDQGEG